MFITPSLIFDSAVNTQAQIKQLRDLVIDLHFQTDPWYKTWAPYLIALGAGLLTIGGQYLIFTFTREKELQILKINTKKEINIKVADLYGKFKAQSIVYNTIFFQYNCADFILRYNLLACSHYEKIINDEEQRGQMTEEETDVVFAKQKYYKEESAKSQEDTNIKFETFKDQKNKIIELLHQIHFYYGDDELWNKIDAFQNIYIYKFKIVQYSEDMAKEEYIGNYIDSNIKPLNVIIKLALEEISSRILLLAKT